MRGLIRGLLTAAAVGAFALTAAAVPSAQAAPAQPSVPYTDPAVTGSIGLCDVHGNNVLSGKVTDKPFVWLAVGTSAAPTAYGVAGRTAFLTAYQPRKGFAPGDWSGYQLAAASRYSSAAHPMSQATPRSSSLQDFLGRYPAQWNGLVQLRLLLSGPNLSPRITAYDATDLQVTGDTWHVVRGGTGPCHAGHAVSTSTLLGLPGSTGLPKPGAVASPPPLTSTPLAQVVGQRTTSTSTDAAGISDDSGLTSASASSNHSTSGSSLVPVLVVAVLAFLVGVSLTWWAARRRAST